MAIIATLRKTTVPVVKVNVAPSGVLQPAAGITLKQQEPEFNRLDRLLDVFEPEHPPQGAGLVYDAATDKYVVQQIDIDGGTF